MLADLGCTLIALEPETHRHDEPRAVPPLWFVQSGPPSGHKWQCPYCLSLPPGSETAAAWLQNREIKMRTQRFCLRCRHVVYASVCTHTRFALLEISLCELVQKRNDPLAIDLNVSSKLKKSPCQR